MRKLIQFILRRLPAETIIAEMRRRDFFVCERDVAEELYNMGAFESDN